MAVFLKDEIDISVHYKGKARCYKKTLRLFQLPDKAAGKSKPRTRQNDLRLRRAWFKRKYGIFFPIEEVYDFSWPDTKTLEETLKIVRSLTQNIFTI